MLADAHKDGGVDAADDGPELPAELRAQLADLSTRLGVDLPEAVLDRCLVAWTQLSGMLGFELTGQFVGSVDPADAFFAHTVERMARFVGLARNG